MFPDHNLACVQQFVYDLPTVIIFSSLFLFYTILIQNDEQKSARFNSCCDYLTTNLEKENRTLGKSGPPRLGVEDIPSSTALPQTMNYRRLKFVSH
jgi:hypothetical protein